VTGREPAILSTVASRAREPTEPDWHNATNSANAAVSGCGPSPRQVARSRRASQQLPGTGPDHIAAEGQRQPAADVRRETARPCSRTLRRFGTCWSPENQENRVKRMVRRQPPWLAEASRCAPGAPARPPASDQLPPAAGRELAAY